MSILRQTSEFGRMPTLKETQSLSAWGALVSACAAWMFDAMDLQIFTLVLVPSVSDLVGSADSAEAAMSTSGHIEEPGGSRLRTGQRHVVRRGAHR
jgi:hypothetical protein